MARMYINPWRKNKDGTPHYQKSEPKLKSAFADKRKKRVHSRAEFGSETVLRRNVWCVLAVESGRGNPWPYAVHGKGLGLSIGASTLPQALCVFANATNYCAMNNKASVQGATWKDLVRWNTTTNTKYGYTTSTGVHRCLEGLGRTPRRVPA